MLLKCYGELSWLPNSVLIGIDLPSLHFSNIDDFGIDCGGGYRPRKQEIFVMEDYEDNLTASVIAHEFMHHLQHLNGVVDDNPARMNPDLDYEDGIGEYFNNHPREYEALLFEHKIAKDWLNEWWLEKLVVEHKLCH